MNNWHFSERILRRFAFHNYHVFGTFDQWLWSPSFAMSTIFDVFYDLVFALY